MFSRWLRHGIITILATANFLSFGINTSLAREKQKTPFLMGTLGLNAIPSARTDDTGTVRLGVGIDNHKLYSYAGTQITDALYINLRQTAEISSLWESPSQLSSGIDVKLRLMREEGLKPEMSLGVQSALGKESLSGEYLAITKEIGNFDITAGIGWGSFGATDNIPNPLRALGGHFSKNRDKEGNRQNTPGNWLTGKNMGLFAGLEYFTPIKGLSLKFDYGGNSNDRDKNSWSAGFAYAPVDWINAGFAAEPDGEIIGRITVQGNPGRWPWVNKSLPRPPRYTIINTKNEPSTTDHIAVNLYKNDSAPHQIGQAARAIISNESTNIRSLEFQLLSGGLKGPSITLIKTDIENTFGKRKQGSSQEIWRNADFTTTKEKIKNAPDRLINFQDKFSVLFNWDNQVSITDENERFLTRSSLIAQATAPQILKALTLEGAFRINLTDNLPYRRNGTRPEKSRRNVKDFANRRLAIDRFYASTTYSFSPEVHTALSAGYLEEMYAGFGGEIIYRPFRSRLSIGSEIWQAYKRDPKTYMNSGLAKEHELTAHLNLWYDRPEENMTVKIRAGRYLAGDIGAGAEIKKRFDNGACLRAFTDITNKSDESEEDVKTNAFHGIELSLPLGVIPATPAQWGVSLKVEPFARKYGQALKTPIDLHSLSAPLTYGHLKKNWNDLTKE